MRSLDVTAVGAGPAAIGMALTLVRLPGIRHAVLEGDRIGESFRRRPQQTRFITPSFHSHPFGLSDLNAVDEASSPAICTGVEHPSGEQYPNHPAFVADGHAAPGCTDCCSVPVAASCLRARPPSRTPKRCRPVPLPPHLTAPSPPRHP